MTWRLLLAGSVCSLAIGLVLVTVSATVELHRVPFQVFTT